MNIIKKRPDNWNLLPINLACNVNPRIIRNNSQNNLDVSFIPMAAVDEEFGEIKRIEKRKFQDVSKGFTYFEENDVLFAKITPCMENGKIAIARNLENGIGFGSTEFHVLRCSESMLPEYLFYFIRQKSFRRYAESFFSGSAGQQRVPNDFFKRAKIPLPPLAEQKQIVAILQEADALRRKKKEILEKSNRLASALFLEMFGDPVRNEKGWDVKKLEEFGKIITGNTPPRENPKNYNDNYIEWIKTDNINNDNIFIAKAKEYLSKEGALIGRVLEPGAVLVTCIAGSLNSIGSVAITDRKVAFNQQINAIQPFENVNSLYILSLIKLSKTSIQSHAKNALKNIISKSVFSNIKFILPPLHLQNDFAKKVEAIEDTTKQIESSLQKMEKLYDSLLQKAFTGNLWFDKLTMTKVS